MSSRKYNHQLTTKPFYLYRVYDIIGRLLYAGISTSVERRSQEHRMIKDWWRNDAFRIESQLIGPRVIAQAAEAAVIRDERPLHNHLGRGSWSRSGAAFQDYLKAEAMTEDDVARQLGVDRMTVRSWLGK